MVKASAQRPELVQMLLVAFSRRICCSRVDRVSTKPRRPSASTVSPTSRPGIWRTNFSRVANRPRYGPPKFSALPSDWPSAGDDVGAHLARRLDQAQRHRLGHHDDQQRARRVAGLGERRRVAHLAEEAGILHHDAGGLGVDRARRDPPRQPDRARSAIDREAGEARMGRGGLAVMRMETAGRGSPSPRRVTRLAIITASAQAVAPSYIEALATSMPVISATWVWNSNSDCSVPCATSG